MSDLCPCCSWFSLWLPTTELHPTPALLLTLPFYCAVCPVGDIVMVVCLRIDRVTVIVQVLRSGQELEYEVEMQPLQTLVPVHKYDQLPSYFI